jgi:hypothetical protein
LDIFPKRLVASVAAFVYVSVGLPDDPDFMGPRIIFSKPLLRVV